MAEFPEDVVIDILSRLPVKPLLRFRCVSKAWRGLIDSRHFIKLHLKRSIETNDNLSLILGTFSGIYSLSLNSLDVAAVELDHPLKCHGQIGRFLGSCHGLILLFYDQEHVGIWNPSTRRYRKLHFPKTRYATCFRGLGYDSVSDDYKVVRMIRLYGKIETEVNVYSLKSDSWRRIQDFPYYLWPDLCCGKFFNGALHWVASRKYEDTSKFVAAFDVATEEYRLFPVPDFGDTSGNFVMNLAVFEGSLCILNSNYTDGYVNVWVMKDYGVKDSWTKLFSVNCSFHCVIPLIHSKNGSRQVLMFESRNKLVWFDLEHSQVKEIETRDLPECFRCFRPDVCVQSLVLNG